MCVGNHYTQTNTNNVNKIRALLKTLGVKTNQTLFLCGNGNRHHNTNSERKAVHRKNRSLSCCLNNYIYYLIAIRVALRILILSDETTVNILNKLAWNYIVLECILTLHLRWPPLLKNRNSSNVRPCYFVG